MLGDAIEYKSVNYLVDTNKLHLESKSHKGIKCIWTKRILNPSPFRINFKWRFDWNELKNKGVDKLTGHIYVFSLNNAFTAKTIDVELTENNQEISEEFDCNYSAYAYDTVYYEYSLTPHYTPVSEKSVLQIPEKPDYDKMFSPSDQSGTILVVDGKRLHVSKAFLSFHSEYFRALFSSNYEEGQMDEIPIEDVSYEDFALLLSTFYPNPVFVTDATVEKLLEMARRFLVSSVINVTEHHLLNMSKIDNQKMLWMADEYGMPTLLEKCIRKINTFAKAKQMKKSEEYKKLSNKTKLKVFDCFMNFI